MYPPLINKLFGSDYAGGKLLASLIPEIFLKKADADAAYLGKSATAAKATADANGKKIHETYTAKTGDQGNISAYATTKIFTTNTTVNDSSDENICVTGAVKITVNDGTAGKSWDKTVDIRNASCSITLGSAWAWAGGKVPKVTANCVLGLHWAKDKGIAVLVATE